MQCLVLLNVGKFITNPILRPELSKVLWCRFCSFNVRNLIRGKIKLASRLPPLDDCLIFQYLKNMSFYIRCSSLQRQNNAEKIYFLQFRITIRDLLKYAGNMLLLYTENSINIHLFSNLEWNFMYWPFADDNSLYVDLCHKVRKIFVTNSFKPSEVKY